MLFKRYLSRCKLILLSLGFTAMLGSITTNIPVAQASAFRCIGTGTPIPFTEGIFSTSWFCFSLFNSAFSDTGLRISSFSVSTGGVDPPNNFQFRLYWEDLEGKRYLTNTGPSYSDGSGGRVWGITYSGSGVLRRQGRVCAVVYQYGQNSYPICHAIFP